MANTSRVSDAIMRTIQNRINRDAPLKKAWPATDDRKYGLSTTATTAPRNRPISQYAEL
jgi:hypothetical protein